MVKRPRTWWEHFTERSGWLKTGSSLYMFLMERWKVILHFIISSFVKTKQCSVQVLFCLTSKTKNTLRYNYDKVRLVFQKVNYFWTTSVFLLSAVHPQTRLGHLFVKIDIRKEAFWLQKYMWTRAFLMKNVHLGVFGQEMLNLSYLIFVWAYFLILLFGAPSCIAIGGSYILVCNTIWKPFCWSCT